MKRTLKKLKPTEEKTLFVNIKSTPYNIFHEI